MCFLYQPHPYCAAKACFFVSFPLVFWSWALAVSACTPQDNALNTEVKSVGYCQVVLTLEIVVKQKSGRKVLALRKGKTYFFTVVPTAAADAAQSDLVIRVINISIGIIRPSWNFFFVYGWVWEIAAFWPLVEKAVCQDKWASAEWNQ